MNPPNNYLIDMDGVLISGNTVVPGAEQFIARLGKREAQFLVLTNNPMYTPRDLSHRFKLIGLEIPMERIFTSAMATARFLRSQRPQGTAFVIGESGLTEAIHEVEYVITDQNPDCGTGRDAYLQSGTHHQGHPIGRERGPLYCDQS